MTCKDLYCTDAVDNGELERCLVVVVAHENNNVILSLADFGHVQNLRATMYLLHDSLTRTVPGTVL
jgi:hypothetical protein